ncbi:MAG: prolyl oligopeptidase family serine peptidase [Dokdonella sp.]
MARFLIAALSCLLTFAAAPALAITLEQAMADPDWIGPPVEQASWSVDGTAVYYRLKQKGTPVRDLHRVVLATGSDNIVDPAAMANADGTNIVFDRARRYAAFLRNGDVFVRDVASGRLIQVTRTPQHEESPQFSADGRAVQYRTNNDWFVFDIASGVTAPAAVIKTEKDPEAKKPDELEELQLRLFSTLRQDKADRDAKKKSEEKFQSDDPSRAPLPIYVGDDVEITGSALSPDGKWMLLTTTAKGYDAGKVAKLQKWVTESGYEEQEDERTRVGRGDPVPESLLLIDITQRKSHKLSYDDLPGIKDDPLKSIREENEKDKAARKKEEQAAQEKASSNESANLDNKSGKNANAKNDAEDKDKNKDAKPKERTLKVADTQWSRDGHAVAVMLRSVDNKDRWIATVDLAGGKLVTQQRLTDPAWINWGFNDFGWSMDDRTLWYLSEETGYSQLYSKLPGAKARALTQGDFEVSHPQLSSDGQWFYVRANVDAPCSYDLYRVPVAGGALTRITTLKGLDEFELSPDGLQVAVLHSSPYVPQQLAVVAADGSAAPRELTDTRTADYKALTWPELQVVGVPSSHTKTPIWSKLYTPAGFDANAAKKYPAVVFVHGAGYLQNTTLGWPNYFREQMFHNLLTEHGYVVIDMDYRASEGYGRDWRTAIYRNMGHPELEDLIDGVNWLVANHAVDSKRVGLYGGSYGGFMSLIAMFRAPEVFSAGAALRPVTDWTSYNHEYTSNILNDPQIDPIAFRRSSPIEFADGLKGSLLIAHGMIDDNVLFQDSVRLYQRLIELRKNDFEIAPYPMERHGFVHPDSWYDEYRRIYKLFESNLK